MTANDVYDRAEALVLEKGLPSEASNDVLAVMRANRSDMVRMLLDACLAAHVPGDVAVARCCALYLNICALQIADDIADGDYGYVDENPGAGAAAQYVLQNLSWELLLRSGLSGDVLARFASRLVRGAGAQALEIRTTSWTDPLARLVGAGFGSEHVAGYLEVLWHGTDAAAVATDLGSTLGRLIHFYADIRTDDPRWRTLPASARVGLLDELCEDVWGLSDHEWPFARGVAMAVQPVFVAERQRLQRG